MSKETRAEYQRGVEEYVAWRRMNRHGRVSTLMSSAKRALREVRARAKLEHQTEREKNGFYDGQTSVATALGAVGRLRRFKDDASRKLVRLV